MMAGFLGVLGALAVAFLVAGFLAYALLIGCALRGLRAAAGSVPWVVALFFLVSALILWGLLS